GGLRDLVGPAGVSGRGCRKPPPPLAPRSPGPALRPPPGPPPPAPPPTPLTGPPPPTEPPNETLALAEGAWGDRRSWLAVMPRPPRGATPAGVSSAPPPPTKRSFSTRASWRASPYLTRYTCTPPPAQDLPATSSP